jgi:hypothetical protein
VHLDSEYGFMVQRTCRDDLVKTHALIRFPAARARNCLDPAESVDFRSADDSRMECVPAGISRRYVQRKETKHDFGGLVGHAASAETDPPTLNAYPRDAQGHPEPFGSRNAQRPRYRRRSLLCMTWMSFYRLGGAAPPNSWRIFRHGNVQRRCQARSYGKRSGRCTVAASCH